jgi:hypothetical protein
MTVPSALDLKKREDKLKQFLKKLNEDGSPQEKHVVAVVRSAIRKAWMKSDVKLAYLYSRTIPDMDNTTRTKWLYECEICKGLFKENEVQCDHVDGNHSFTKTSDFDDYFNNILMVGFDGLQLLCCDIPSKNHIGCHSYKTLSESLNITFEESKIEKVVIQLCKMKAGDIDKWLAARGVQVAKNPTARRNAIREALKNERD